MYEKFTYLATGFQLHMMTLYIISPLFTITTCTPDMTWPADNTPTAIHVHVQVYVYVNTYSFADSYLPTFFEPGDSKAVSVGVPGVRFPRPLRRPVS